MEEGTLAECLSELDRLASVATPAPWVTGRPAGLCDLDHEHGRGDCDYRFRGRYDDGTIYPDHGERDGDPFPDHLPVAGTWDYDCGGIRRPEDAAFIATLRNTYPDLIAAARERDAMRAELDRLRATAGSLDVLADSVAAMSPHGGPRPEVEALLGAVSPGPPGAG